MPRGSTNKSRNNKRHTRRRSSSSSSLQKSQTSRSKVVNLLTKDINPSFLYRWNNKHSLMDYLKMIGKQLFTFDENGKNTQNTFTKLSCSPYVYQQREGNNPEYTNQSCLPIQVLQQMSKEWNKENPKDKIPSNISVLELYDSLKQKLSYVCNNERCWTHHLAYPELGVSKYFAPNQPKSWSKKPNIWLSDYDITEVLKQHSEVYPWFTFINPAPIDFDEKYADNTCITTSLCRFNLKSYMDRGITKIGIVFNTDTHDGGGEHWISTMIDIPHKLIYFFDSAGDKCPPEINRLVKRIQAQGKLLGIPFTFDQNYPFIHQYSTSECGMYTLFFIINMVFNRIHTPHLKTKRIPDELMTELRNVYFNPL
jgi:hypothetical protein